MSNIIKAAAVTYTNEKRKIDFNDKAEEFTRLFADKHVMVRDTAESEGEVTENDGFVPGIEGIAVEQKVTQITNEPEQEGVSALQIQEQEEEFRQRAEQILDEAREEVKRMLEDARLEAEKIRSNTFEQAKREGYQEGKARAQEELAAARQETDRQLRENKALYKKQVEELEPAFVEVIIRIMEKLTGVILEEKRDIITYLLEQGIQEIEPSKNYLIHVSKEDYEVAHAAKPRIAMHIKENAVLEFVSDQALHNGQCLIETDSRVFDCSLDMQFKNLILDLRMLADRLPEEEQA